MSSSATKKKLERATGVDASDLAYKKHFIALKAEADKLDINRLANTPTGFNDLKRRLDKLDVGKLETVPKGLKKLRDVVVKDIVKMTVHNTLNTKVNSFEIKFF